MQDDRGAYPRPASISTRVVWRRSVRCAAFAGLALAAAQAQAAGGHHAVDDAALLDPGQCQVETWFDRENGHARSLLHAGPVCRIGAVELGLSLDRVRGGEAPAASSFGAQIKWARSLDERWSIGAAWALAGQGRSPRYIGSGLVIPVTWKTSDTVFTHLNLGRDFLHRQPDLHRAGLALEWAPLEAASLIAERYREGGTNFWRVGARWALTPSINLDLSRARGLHGSAPAWWTLGLTWAFDR